MKLFKKRNTNQNLQDILYGPYDHITSVPYGWSKEWTEFQKNFDKTCKEMLSSKSVDEYNESYIDKLVDMQIALEKEKLKLQRIDHSGVNRNIAETRATSIDAAKTLQESLLKEKQDYLEEKHLLERLFSKNTVYDELKNTKE